MPWTYEISTGRMFDPTGALAGQGYSGAPLKPGDQDPGQPGHINDPADEALKAQGPIPAGWYTMGKAVDNPTHGPVTIPLIPDAANDMHGRSGFLCHGDSIKKPGTASLGCIIQHRPTRLAMDASLDRRLQAVDFLEPSTVTATAGA